MDIEALGEQWYAIFQTLAAGTRRQIIGSLLEVQPDRELELPEAANLPNYRIDPETLQTNLVHNHLPMMAEAGFVEWGRDPFYVKQGPRFDEVAAVILAIDAYDEFPDHLIEDCYFHNTEVVDR